MSVSGKNRRGSTSRGLAGTQANTYSTHCGTHVNKSPWLLTNMPALLFPGQAVPVNSYRGLSLTLDRWQWWAACQDATRSIKELRAQGGHFKEHQVAKMASSAEES